MPADTPPTIRATIRTSIVGANAASEAGRDRQQHAEDEHELAAVAVAQRAEPQHRRRQTERIADGHEVERRL